MYEVSNPDGFKDPRVIIMIALGFLFHTELV